ncbi:MAG TPA: hypothetical protein VMV86_02990 [Methanosarcinales archaeon]|nr:hypothetical protein [Methanosarcinales archaeon]
MPLNLRGKPVNETLQSVSSGEHVISAVGCGVISVILTAPAAVESSIKLYDVKTVAAVTAAETAKEAKKALLIGGTSGIAATAVYCPCKPDAYSNGVVAIVAGAAAKAYISIEP